ncbi:carbonic anhydrase [Thiomonas bhubaneswarensis]|uniref:carbonic anhydrase n=1 Tax=Thiomonas bhubaneswarensis TaxID=339866 RepID=A0A0K6I8N4_9BURK|nr:carbonic anhydrase [Thiomonas bhubaneswarensis]CUA99413.1 Carbonic anhydrase [Thiomonas bhubaneswarensis]
MPDEFLTRLRRFHTDSFPAYQTTFENLVHDGQRPSTLFIGCSDSRVLPYLLTGAGPGELFLVRNVGGFVPPFDGSSGYHGTAAAIEYATLNLGVQRIVVCGHSHCGAIRGLYGETCEEAHHLKAWLNLGRDAMLPVAEPSPEALRRTEQRAVILQLERLMDYPMVRRRVEERRLTLHGWHYVIEDGQVDVFDVQSGHFIPASKSLHSGTGPYVDPPADAGEQAVAPQVP